MHIFSSYISRFLIRQYDSFKGKNTFSQKYFRNHFLIKNIHFRHYIPKKIFKKVYIQHNLSKIMLQFQTSGVVSDGKKISLVHYRG